MGLRVEDPERRSSIAASKDDRNGSEGKDNRSERAEWQARDEWREIIRTEKAEKKHKEKRFKKDEINHTRNDSTKETYRSIRMTMQPYGTADEYV